VSLGSCVWDSFSGTGLLCIDFATASTMAGISLQVNGMSFSCCVPLFRPLALWGIPSATMLLRVLFGVGPFFCAAVLFGIVEMEYTVDSRKERSTFWHYNSCSSCLKNDIMPLLLRTKTNFTPIFSHVRIQITSTDHMHGGCILHWYSVSTSTVLKGV